MSTIRIYRVAEVLGLPSQEVIDLLRRQHGIEVKSASSTIEEIGARQFGERMALACSFGAEDVVLAEMAARVHPGARVFYLDTDFLFSETPTVRERIAAQYPLKIEACRPALSPP